MSKTEEFEFFGAADGVRRLEGASVLVTGATGSFGQRFVRTLLARGRPKRLIVFSRDDQAAGGWPVISLAAVAMLAVNAPLSFVLPGVLTRNALRQVARGTWQRATCGPRRAKSNAAHRPVIDHRLLVQKRIRLEMQFTPLGIEQIPHRRLRIRH